MRPLHLIGICICTWSEVHGRFGVLSFNNQVVWEGGASSEGVKFAYGTGEARELFGGSGA